MLHEPDLASIRRAFKPLAVLAGGLLLAVLLPVPSWSHGLASYATLHLAFEMVSIVVSAMVFSVAWGSVSRHERSDAVWLGAAFLGVGVLDLLHTMSYAGMPDFVTPSGPEKAISFWLAARTLAALGLLGIVVRPPDWPRTALQRHGLLAGVLALVAAVSALVLWRPDLVPRTFVAGQGLTHLKVGWEFVLVGANLAVALLLFRRGRGARPFELTSLFIAACTMAMSELFFSFYADVTDLYNLMGHVYKAVAYLYLYRAIFVEAVDRPYRELSATEDRLRTTYETIPDLLWLKDRDGVYLDCNPAFERLYGAPRSAIVGKRDHDFVSTEIADFFRLHDRRAMAAGRPSVNEEWLSFASDGYRGLFETVKTPMHDRNGRLVGVLGIARDITERRRADEERKSLETQLREAQKMESLGTLAGGIAHDFNNVLGAIIGHLALAREQLPTDHAARQHLDQIGRSSTPARELVQQILAFSRRQPQSKLDQPLRPLVEEALTLLRATLPARVRLSTVLDDTPVWVRADGTQIHQVLMNLCTNAWHALEDAAGDIEVGLGTADAPPASTCQTEPGTGRCAHLWVRDSGRGMDAATVARIFDPFFTTKPTGHGTGLGLSVVHGIIAAHGGEVRVDSAPGRGSTFHVYLPACPAPQAADTPAAPHAASPAPPPEDGEQGRGRHVIVVDDDAVMLLLVEQLLRRQGWRVTGCASAGEALAKLRDAGASVAAIVTDFNMPDASGLELAAEVTRSRPGLPVIVSSGYVSEELLAGIGAAGVRRVVQKQNTLEDLPRILVEVLSD